MKKYILPIILSFIFIPSVQAEPLCNNSKLSTYRDLAENITYNYSYNQENDTFDITFVNVDSSFYLINSTTNERYNYAEEMKINNLKPGKSYKMKVYTNDAYCINKNLYTIYINLPYYNIYYNDGLCKDISDFKYCKKFINIKLSRNDFKKLVEEYKNSLNNIIEEEEETNKTLIDKMINLDKRIYIGIIIAIIALIFIIRYFYNKKHDLF